MRKQNEKLKILLVMTANMNLGDTVLSDNDYFLLKKAFGNREVDILRYSIFSHDPGQVKYVDAVVFAGGIVKTTDAVFKLHIPEIVFEAEKYSVPVFMSAIGAQPFIYTDESSEKLREAVNLPCIKSISVRDDIASLKRDYLHPGSKTRVRPVYDPAVWCAETYADVLPKSFDPEANTVIGLGITRELLFSDYGHEEIDKRFQLDFWRDTALLLEKKGYKWKLFTNGDTFDERFAMEVLEYIGHGEKEGVPRDGAALVKMISTFRGVIAIRMHSNIIAYSLGIPSIGVIWNQKVRFWGEKIGYPERFMEPADMNAENAVNRLCAALKKKMGLPPRRVKSPVYKEIRKFVKKLRPREKSYEDIDFAGKLCAASLGGIDVRYRSTNSPEAFAYSLDNGYLSFQLDVRLTKEDIAVLVNRWHKESYRIMNLCAEEGEYQKALSLEDFTKAKYYYRFATYTLEGFMKDLAQNDERDHLNFIISIGRPSAEKFRIFSAQLAALIKENGLSPESFILRLERREDILLAEEYLPGIKLMFFQVNPKKSPEENKKILTESLEFCKDHNIGYFSMKTELYDDDVAGLVASYPIKLAIFSFVCTEKIINAIKGGAAIVGSQYYGVDYLERLTK